MDEAMKLAEEIAAQAPIAVALCKEAINVGMQTDLNSALKFEGNVFGQCFATEDQKYGMAYFLDKNKEKPAKDSRISKLFCGLLRVRERLYYHESLCIRRWQHGRTHH